MTNNQSSVNVQQYNSIHMYMLGAFQMVITFDLGVQ